MFFVLLLTPLMVQHFKIRNYKIGYEKKNKRMLLFFFVFLTILVMLRHESIGTDTRNYIYYFNKISNMDWITIGKQYREVGFSYFIKVVSLFSKEKQFFFAVVAIGVFCMLYPTYKRLCVDSSLTIVLFCIMPTFVMMFSGIRQMIAIGIGFIAYELVRQKRVFPFIVVVCLAMTFHTSAFMLIFMYPIYHAKITKKWLWFVIPLLITTFILNKQIFSILGLILERYTDYSATIVKTGAYTMLILFGIFMVISYVIPEESRLDEETIGLRNFLLVSVAIQLFAPLHTIAMRMNYYYIIFIPLLLPRIIGYRSRRWCQGAIVIRNMMVLFFLVYFFMNAYRGSNLKVFPYHFFWENI